MIPGNVLYVTVDQWRADCLGIAGHPVVQTPNLDALARRGVRFANHWSVTAPCGPSRASLHTGRYLMNHRSVGNGTPLDASFDNVAWCARRAGYDPTLFGYTDTSVDPRTVDDPDDPRLQDYEGLLPGFSVGTLLTSLKLDPWLRWLASKGFDVPSDPARIHDPVPDYPGAADRGSSWAPLQYPAELTETAFLTGEVIEWIDQRPEGAPWFAHVSYVRPHPPYRAPEGYHDLYDPADGPAFRRHPDRSVEVHTHLIHATGASQAGCPVDEAEARQLRATYWANMTEVDHQIGRLLDHVEAGGRLDDTLVVLTSDHGDMMGDHWLIEKFGWWDESYRVPMIFADPRPAADASRGSAVEAFTESVDVLPTICEWMDVDAPVAADGRSLLPFLEGDRSPADWRTASHQQWDFRDPVDHLAEDALGLTMEQCSLDVVRTSTAKYVQVGDGSCLYFDLDTDPEQIAPTVLGPGESASDPSASAAISRLREHLLLWRMRHDDRTMASQRLTERGLVARLDPRR